MKVLTLTTAQLSTIELALATWIARCRSEATAMDELAIDLPGAAEQCRKNAEASRKFKCEAEAVFDAIKGA